MTPIDQLRRMATKDENGLLHCPFCGGKASIAECPDDIGSITPEDGRFVVVCDNCALGAPAFYVAEEKAICVWNTRAIDAPALLAEIEKMQECLAWYADKGNHEILQVGNIGLASSPIDVDEGQRARDCLNGLTKEKKND